jgi:hypothetical protein
MNRFAASTRLLALLLVALTVPPKGICAPQSNPDKPTKGEGAIDRVIATGNEPEFRADGYTFRILPATEVRLGKGLQALSEVGTYTWVTFEGRPDDSGTILATKAAFSRLKSPRREPDPKAVQFITFAPGTRIDGYSGFETSLKPFPPEDHGGWCGWYNVPSDPADQERVRNLGQKLVPQYQRDLAYNDPAKIPFRFYMVEETETRSAIFCGRGLVLVPTEAVHRLQNEDQLAAVLADGIAGVLQEQADLAHGFTLKDAAKLAPAFMGPWGVVPAAVGSAGEMTIRHKAKSTLEHTLGRMALGYMADAGFDPHQAPEAWRLLAPGSLPKDNARLKYPERSRYLQSILEAQYKVLPGTTSSSNEPGAVITPDSHAEPQTPQRNK